MTNPVLWFINRFTKEGSEVLKIGSRVKTKHGWGTVKSANIMVTLDNPIHPSDHPQFNNHQWTFNIGKELR